MSDIVELVIDLKQMVSGGLQKMAADAKASLGGIDSNLNSTQGKLNDLSRPVKLNIDIKGLDNAQASIDSTNEKMGLLKNSSAMFLGSLGAQLVSRGASDLLGLGKEVLTSGMQAGATKMQFGVLAGKEDGAHLYSDITKYVQDSIFGPELYQNAKQMMAFGIAAKDIMPTMKMLGDVSMGDKGRMDQLTLAFSQTTSAGKLMGQDLLQYVAAGFNPLNEIAQKTHKSMSTLRDEMSEGKISAGMVRDAFIQATSEGGKFHGMLDEMGRTPFGRWQAITGSIENSIMTLGTSLDSPLNKLFDDMANDVEKLPELVEKIAPVADRLLGTFENLYTWTSKNSESIGNWFNVLKLGAEIYIGYKGVMIAAGMAMNVYDIATTAATRANILLGSAEIAATAAATNQGIAITVAAADYAYYTTSTVAATEATVALDAAFALSPWVIIAGGVGLVAGAYLLLKDNINDADVKLKDFIGDSKNTPIYKYDKGVLQIMMQDKDGDYGGIEYAQNYPYQGKDLDLTRKQQKRDIATIAGANAGNSNIDPLGLLGLQEKKADYFHFNDGSAGYTAPTKGANTKEVDDATNNITGGGRRQIIINVNKSFVENFTIQAKEVREGYTQLKQMVGEAFLEMLDSSASVHG